MADGTPPEGGTRNRGPFVPNIMTPSWFQEPPSAWLVISAMLCGGPPDISIFLSFLVALNAMNRLSGDQKGGEGSTPSVPRRECTSREPTARNQRRRTPSAPVPATPASAHREK